VLARAVLEAALGVSASSIALGVSADLDCLVHPGCFVITLGVRSMGLICWGFLPFLGFFPGNHPSRLVCDG
jgi:hypothetical protein